MEVKSSKHETSSPTLSEASTRTPNAEVLTRAAPPATTCSSLSTPTANANPGWIWDDIKEQWFEVNKHLRICGHSLFCIGQEKASLVTRTIEGVMVGNFFFNRDAACIVDILFKEKVFVVKYEEDERALQTELYNRVLPTQPSCQGMVLVPEGLVITSFALLLDFFKENQDLVDVSLLRIQELFSEGKVAYEPLDYSEFAAKVNANELTHERGCSSCCP